MRASLTFALCLALTGLLPLHAAAPSKKLKVFILAGQSNMEGHAKVETFDYLGDDPTTARLLQQDPLKAELVKMRYFVGLNHQEIADALGIAEPTVRRRWAYARAWLYAELKSQR